MGELHLSLRLDLLGHHLEGADGLFNHVQTIAWGYDMGRMASPVANERLPVQPAWMGRTGRRRTLAGRMRIDTEFEPLVTERLLLRRSRPEDAETISAYRRDPDVNRYQGWKRTDPEGVRREIEEMAGRVPGEPGGWVQLTVEEGRGGLLVGDVGLSLADDEPGVIKVGYTIAPEFQGRGYGTEAVRALVAYALDTLGADVVRAYADAENVPSIRVAEKVGMRLVERFEGRDSNEVWVGLRYELRRGERW
jgi:RimJ/RimL family protein N-acetyltransferase